MITTMLILFVVGYAFIAFEHKTGINKSAIALLMCGILWSIFSLEYPSALPGLTQTTVSDEILRHLGSTCEILVFLIGAMTIVDLIDFHGGFEFITRRITTRRKVRLLWLVALLTFFMSALLDNMTTTIIMVMLLRKMGVSRKGYSCSSTRRPPLSEWLSTSKATPRNDAGRRFSHVFVIDQSIVMMPCMFRAS